MPIGYDVALPVKSEYLTQMNFKEALMFRRYLCLVCTLRSAIAAMQKKTLDTSLHLLRKHVHI